MSPRLDEGDYRTICGNIKYKALKYETIKKTESPLVILTNDGVSYLNDKWSANVDKNGTKRKEKKNCKPFSEANISVNQADVQRMDNRIFNLITQFYSEPTK